MKSKEEDGVMGSRGVKFNLEVARERCPGGGVAAFNDAKLEIGNTTVWPARQ